MLYPSPSEAQRTCDACSTQWYSTGGRRTASTTRALPPSPSPPHPPFDSTRGALIEVDCLEFVQGTAYKKYAVTIPSDISGGDVFLASLDNRLMNVILPTNVASGDTILVRAPHPSADSSSLSSPGLPHRAPRVCAACTFENTTEGESCSMCSTPLPPPTSDLAPSASTSFIHDEPPAANITARVLELHPSEPHEEHNIVIPDDVAVDDVFQVVVGKRQRKRVFSLLCPTGARPGQTITVRAPKDDEHEEDEEEEEEEGETDEESAGVLAQAIVFGGEAAQGGEEEGQMLAAISHSRRQDESKDQDVGGGEGEGEEEAIRESLLLTKQQPLLHLHYTLQRPEEDDDLESFRASLVLDSGQKQMAGATRGRASSLEERRRMFLQQMAVPIAEPSVNEKHPKKSATGSSSHPPADGRTCDKCTFVNPNLAILCSMCDEPLQHSLRKEGGAGGGSSSAKAINSASGVAAAVEMILAEADPFISCPECTLENLPGTSVCEACDHPLTAPNVGIVSPNSTLMVADPDSLPRVEVLGTDRRSTH